MLEIIKKYKWLLTSGIFGVAFILSIFAYEFSPKKNHKPSVATVNVNAIMTHYVQKQAKLNIDNALLQEATKAFVHELEKEIKILADKKEVILFVSEAVLAGAQDYTPELERKVYQALTKSKVLK